MKIQGISIDTQKLAQGMYDLFTEEEQAVVAFGMIPAEKMECTERLLGEKIETTAKDDCEKSFGFRPDRDCAKKDLKKDFVREAMHEITVAIFGHAKSIGRMVV